jgi:hypothetical protein
MKTLLSELVLESQEFVIYSGDAPHYHSERSGEMVGSVKVKKTYNDKTEAQRVAKAMSDSGPRNYKVGPARKRMTESEVLDGILEEMDKPVKGKQYGTTDQGKPENHSVEELSRVADLLWAATQVGGRKLSQDVFKLLPQSLRGEFNYANWKYKDHA